MTGEDFILALLASLPGGRLGGRKRLQKLAMLTQAAGLAPDLGLRFRLHQFGPYSAELAESADRLVADGRLTEAILPSGPYRTLRSDYSLPAFEKSPEPLPEAARALLMALDGFTTTELEIASTIAFFEGEGGAEDGGRGRAVERTRDMKPTKACPRTLARAEEILRLIGD